MKVLVTGASGFIASHALVELLAAGHEVCGIDNLSNSSEESIRRVRKISGREVEFLRLDLLELSGLQRLFSERRFDAVVHFAGKKAVGESVQLPLVYYRNNVTGTLNLLECTAEVGLPSPRVLLLGHRLRRPGVLAHP